MMALLKDERAITVERLEAQPHAKILTLRETMAFLASPDSGVPLHIVKDRSCLTDGEHDYPVIGGVPVLYPASISEAFLGGGLELKYYDDSRLQYFLLSQIKQRGEINAAPTNVHYQRHLFRMKEFLKDCSGTVLDVGCDNAGISSSLFNKECGYIGLDPFSSSKLDFRIVGVGEFLPIRDMSVDHVVFNTSLDHILDYHRVLEEAERVLKPGGQIHLSILIWIAHASLLNDAVHFHHFREYEILGALNGMRIGQCRRYQYKDDRHRYGLYISASKE